MKFDEIKREDRGVDYIGNCDRPCYSTNKEGMGIEQCDLLNVPEMTCQLEDCKT